jgi:hypothetical protein
MTILVHVGLGCRFGGTCPVCGRSIDRQHELTAASLYRRPDGKYAAVHTECAGGRTKSRVGGGMSYRTQPRSTIEVAS